MDKFYRERRKIIGGPGCGKTHKLLEKLKGQFDTVKWLIKGIDTLEKLKELKKSLN